MAILAFQLCSEWGRHFLHARGSILEVCEYHLPGCFISAEHIEGKPSPLPCYVLVL